MSLYWQEETDPGTEFEVPGDVVDLLFRIQCRSLPLDHGQLLAEHLPMVEG